MKRVVISLLLAIALVVPLANAQDEKQKYPTITVYFSDGTSTNITEKQWVEIFPIIQGRIKGYDWSGMMKELLFDSSNTGLNPYGLDFVRGIEKHTLNEWDNNYARVVIEALNYTYDLDSDGDGYTNYEELNAGTLPGDASSHPGLTQEEFWNKYEGYIIIGVLVASIFVLYFVFNREKE